MKKTGIYIMMNLSLLLSTPMFTGCDDEFTYSKDYSVYDGVTLNVKMAGENNVLDLNLINKTYRVQVNVTPQDVRINSQEYIYEIEDETIATIDANGLITMLKEGETKLNIKLEAKPEIATSCVIRVKPIVANKLHLPEEVAVKETQTFNLGEEISVTPSIASTKFDYKVEDENIATISEEGIITGVNAGTTKVTVSTTDGSNISEEIDVKVTGFIYIEEIKFSDEIGGMVLKVNDKINLAEYTTILPEDAENKEIKYSIVNGDDVISLTPEGNVTCLKVGKATVKAESQDGSNVTSEIEINVYKGELNWVEDRTSWAVTTSALYEDGLNYVPDGQTGKPEDILDGNSKTYLSIRKPEWFTVENKPAGNNKEIYFIIDTQGETTFNYIRYEHRPLNNTLSANTIEVSGSNNGTDFTLIKDNIDTNWGDGKKIFEVKVPDSQYRYIKVKATDWREYGVTDKMGSSVQIAEFNVGNVE